MKTNLVRLLPVIAGLAAACATGPAAPTPAATAPPETAVAFESVSPTPEPRGEPRWTAGSYFPRFPAPQRLEVIRVSSGLEDWYRDARRPEWRADQSPQVMAALTLVHMQGVINRSDPAIYLDWQDAGTLRGAARFWLTVLADRVPVQPVQAEGTAAVEHLWRQFSGRFRGAVVYDPAVPDTINLATMIAGLEDRLVLAPDQLELPAIGAILADLEARCPAEANPLGLPALAGRRCTADLRPLAAQQGWREPSGDPALLSASRGRLYAWAHAQLWPRLERRAIGLISPGPPSSAWLQDARSFDPLGLAWRDYLVALRLPALWLSTQTPAEAALLERFLAEAPAPIPLLSFFDGDEPGTTALASRHGDWVPVLSNTNTPISGGNLTVLSAVDAPVQAFRPRLRDDQLFAALGAQPVVTVWSSDGDSIQFLLDRGFHGGVDFHWEAVRGQSFGWSINPILADLAPAAWNSYVQTAGETSLVAGLSGAGYIYPALMNDAQLDAYLERAARSLRLTGLRTLYVDERAGTWDERLGALYDRRLKPAGYLGAFATFGTGAQAEERVSYPGSPAPIVRAAHTLTPGSAGPILQSLFGAEPGAIQYDFPEAAANSGERVADASASGGAAVRFRRAALANCCMVFAGPRTTLAPGHYTATYRLRTDDNTAGLPFAHLMFLRQVGDGMALAERTLRPTDFRRAGEWQAFDLALDLDAFTPQVQLWLDYSGGTPGAASADLALDTITLQRQGGPALPNAAAVFIGLVGPAGPLDHDLARLTAGVEERGGVLLTPDEFMAALNPEFMLGWAEGLLGPDQAVLAEARRQLAAGDYMASLYTVREAVRAFPRRAYPAGGGAAVEANAWITGLQFDARAGRLDFAAHAAPGAAVHLSARVPAEGFGPRPSVAVDGVSAAAAVHTDGAWLQVEVDVPGGPHAVQVTRP